MARGPAPDAAFLARVRSRGDQGTRDRYARFVGIEALRAALRSAPALAFDAG
jgi:hypothetical protein